MSLKRIIELQSQIFRLPNVHTVKSHWQELMTYYPPGISVHKLAQQDPELRKLGLRDEWLDKKLNREIMLKQRNKNIRVSVVLGPLKPVEKQSGKKRRKK